MNIKVNWLPKTGLTGTTNSGHSILLNGDKTIVGQTSGPGSKELILLALGSSATVSVIHILRKSNVDIWECRTKASPIPEESEITDLEAIHLHFELVGSNLSDTNIDRTLALAVEKQCPVSVLLRRSGITITHELTARAHRSARQNQKTSALPCLITQGLHHVALTSTNFEASREFYTEIMKMQVEWEPDSDNVYLTNGTDNLAIHRGSPIDSKLDHIGFILDCEEHVDQWFRYLSSNNVQIVKEPKTHRDGARSFYVLDPDGVSVQLIYHPPLSKTVSSNKG